MNAQGGPLAGLVALSSPPTPPVPLDDVDRALLSLLAQDSCASQRSLARALGVSAPTIGDRLGRLERTGVIRGYGVVVDWGALGFPVVVYLAITAGQGHELGPVMTAVAQGSSSSTPGRPDADAQLPARVWTNRPTWCGSCGASTLPSPNRCCRRWPRRLHRC